MEQVMIFLIGVFFGYVGAKLIQKKELSVSNSEKVDDSTEKQTTSGDHPDPDKEEK